MINLFFWRCRYERVFSVLSIILSPRFLTARQPLDKEEKKYMYHLSSLLDMLSLTAFKKYPVFSVCMRKRRLLNCSQHICVDRCIGKGSRTLELLVVVFEIHHQTY